MHHQNSRASLKREKEDFRRLVAEMVAEEIKKMRQEQQKGKPNHISCSFHITGFLVGLTKLSDKFVEHVSIMGVSEAIKSKHRLVKILWTIIFVAGLAATGYFVYRILDEYRNDPTATKVGVESETPFYRVVKLRFRLKQFFKVTIVKNANYSFPPVVICLDAWLDARKVFALGLSKEAVEYALRYLMLFEEVGGKVKPSGNHSDVQKQFYKVYNRHNFTSLIQFYKHVAVDVVSDSKNPSEVTYSCTGCEDRKRLEKVVMNRGVCHRIVLKDVDGKLRQSYGLPEIRLRVPDLSAGLVDGKGYWRLFVKPLVRQPINASPFVSIYTQHSHAVRISSSRFDMVYKSKDPCIANDPTARFDDPALNVYSSLSCSLSCVCESYRKLYGCTVLNLDMNFTSPPSDYCNTYYWGKWPKQHVDEESEKREMLNCIDECPHECSTIMYNTMVDVHESKELVAEMVEWNNDSALRVSECLGRA